MKTRRLKKLVSLLLAVLTAATMFAFPLQTAAADGDAASAAEDRASVISKSIEEVQEILNAKTYTDYLALHANAPKAKTSVTVAATAYDAAQTTAKVRVETIEGKQALVTPDNETVAWSVSIPDDGLYSVEFEYYPVLSGRTTNIERAFRVDGVIPFKESRYLSMTKVWKNDLSKGEGTETGFEMDSNGNDVRPNMYEDPQWMTYTLSDSTGYYLYPFEYYLTAGTHTITITGAREEVALASITFKPRETVMTYEEYSAQNASKGYQPASADAVVRLQAEKPFATSSQTVYPTYDRTSPITDPQDPSKIRLNTLGKQTTWQSMGEWAEYKLTVPESGLYSIVARFKQSEMEGTFVSRQLTIDGELPFAECQNLRFTYNEEFQAEPLTDGKTQFQFYFEAGKEYTLRFEVVLGDMSELIGEIQGSLTKLNDVYMKIKQITGAIPDQYRDYNFMDLIPLEMDTLVIEGRKLADFSTRLEEIVGARSSNCATLEEIARISEKMGRDEDEVAKNLENLKSNIGTLGTWMNNARMQPLEVDFFQVQSPDAKLPQSNANFFQALAFEVRQFFASFYTDYNSLGDAESQGSEGISVWVTTGRDQSQIVRQMINDMFTPATGVNVQLKLVAGGTLLPATLAGTGPEVAYMGGSDPINYAIRSAVQKLNDFDTFDEVCSRFNSEALVPFTLYGDVYAMPETLTYYMLFYRQDIFSSLNLDVPTTWDDLKGILPVLQSQYMQVAMPKELEGFKLLFYQKGGDLYADDGMRINLDSNLALETFKELCDLFTQYEFPLSYDFFNRFRTGEIPIGVQLYSNYTQLSAFATEIRGLWTMTTIPGYEIQTENGKTVINNTSSAAVSGVVMMSGAKNTEGAWKYIDWITSAEAQTRYGNEYTALLGNSTIHPTANEEAMKNMSWSSSELETLMAQYSNLKATPEYPGSYIVTRYVQFAFLAAYNDAADPVDSMLSNVIYINKEISRKRQEFGLDTLEIGETLADREAKKAAEESATAD